MKADAAYSIFNRNRSRPLWKLLASDNGPVVLAVLSEVFDGSAVDMPASEFLQKLENALESVRLSGADITPSARECASHWCAEHWLERRLPQQADEDVYSLTAFSAEAIRFVNSIESPRSKATESRLALVIEAVKRLADESDPNIERRRERLLKQREEISARIAALDRGEQFEVIDERAGRERLAEIQALFEELSGDFYRVRSEFESIVRGLRRQIMSDTAARSEVLEDIFHGLDVLMSRPAGRTFTAFWQLLNDPVESARFEDAIESVLERDFAEKLSVDERRMLRRMRSTLLEKAGEVQKTTMHLACSLRRFVEGAHYREEKVFQRELGEALTLGAEAAKTMPLTVKLDGIEAGRPCIRPISFTAYLPYDPDRNAPPAPPPAVAAPLPAVADLASLLGEPEPDMDRLREQVNALIAEYGQCTIGDVLRANPAKEGLATVTALMFLAAMNASEGGGTEPIEWNGLDGVSRKGMIDEWFFTKELHND